MKIVFMGTPDFAANILKQLLANNHQIVLVVSQPDRPVGRKKELIETPVKKIAKANNIEVFQPERIKLDFERIKILKPDLIITAAYGQIIPKELLDIPRLGCINVHASLLPKYRGGAPIHQAVIDGEKETGITIMYMAEEMDNGDIISQAVIPISDYDDTGTLFFKLSNVGAKLLIETLPSIYECINSRTPQNHALATYAYNIKREDERVVWTKDARSIYNHIRGLNPWPTAYTTIGDINLKIFKSQLLNEKTPHEPGTILDVNPEFIAVATGSGESLHLTEIQLSGKKRMPIKDLLNGEHPFNIGTKLV